MIGQRPDGVQHDLWFIQVRGDSAIRRFACQRFSEQRPNSESLIKILGIGGPHAGNRGGMCAGLATKTAPAFGIEGGGNCAQFCAHPVRRRVAKYYSSWGALATVFNHFTKLINGAQKAPRDYESAALTAVLRALGSIGFIVPLGLQWAPSDQLAFDRTPMSC